MDYMGIGVLAISAGLSLSAFFRAADAEGKADGCSCSRLARRRSPLPDVPGQENGGGGTGKAGEPAGAEAERPGGELRRPAE